MIEILKQNSPEEFNMMSYSNDIFEAHNPADVMM